MSFYYPYNFTPADSTTTPSAEFDYPFGTRKTGTSQLARHDVWLNNHRSGCVICHIKLATPTIVGAKHTPDHSGENSPATVEPYRWRKEAALPANSLRGMIASTLESISQSSLRVLDPQYWPAFEHIHKNLPPWSPKRTNKDGLTPAELLFGVVDDNSQAGSSEESRSLASRVRFFDACLANRETDPLLAQQTLKELATPNPQGKRVRSDEDYDRPSPYFSSATGGHISYRDVTSNLNTGKARPHGRKFYLRHHSAGDYIYTGNKIDRKLRCQAIRPETEFYFHIQFDNLSQAELRLLLIALSPSPTHIFQIGLGKAMGLGALHLKAAGIFIEDHAMRFSKESLLRAHKYHQVSVDKVVNGWKTLPRYDQEKLAAEDASLKPVNIPEDASLVNSDALAAVKRTGDLNQVKKGIKIGWRGNRAPAAPLPPIDCFPDRLPQYGETCPPPTTTKPDSAAPNPQERENEPPNHVYIFAPDEEITQENTWLRNTIASIDQKASFEEAMPRIKRLLTGNALAIKWQALPGETPDERAFKTAVKQLIMRGVQDRDISHNFLGGGGARAKRTYDSWPDEEE